MGRRWVVGKLFSLHELNRESRPVCHSEPFGKLRASVAQRSEGSKDLAYESNVNWRETPLDSSLRSE